MGSQTCKGADCGASIIYAKSITTGKLIPLDARAHPIYRSWADPDTGERLCEQVTEESRARDGGPLRISHFATCPNAADFSRRGGSDGGS